MRLVAEKAKEQIVKIGQKMSQVGLVIGTWGNISCRISEENVCVITPSGMDYNVLKPSDMVVLDMDAKVVEGERKPSTESLMHLAIYRARQDVMAVVHTHSVFASSLAVARVALPPILEDLVELVGGGVNVAAYELPGTPELADAVVTALGECNAVLMANHGMVGVGRNLGEALQVCQIVERACQVYAWAQIVGNPQVISPEHTKQIRHAYLNHYGQR